MSKDDTETSFEKIVREMISESGPDDGSLITEAMEFLNGLSTAERQVFKLLQEGMARDEDEIIRLVPEITRKELQEFLRKSIELHLIAKRYSLFDRQLAAAASILSWS